VDAAAVDLRMEAIEDNHVVTSADQTVDQVGTDETGTSGHHDAAHQDSIV
jgi:hypothetical protein